jgi:hypothetical protein
LIRSRRRRALLCDGGSKPSNPSPGSGYGSLRPDGAPSAGSATVAKSERPGCSTRTRQTSRSVCFKTWKDCLWLSCRLSARGPRSPSRQAVHIVRSPLGTNPKTSRVFALFTMSKSLVSSCDQTGRTITRMVLPV